MVLLFEMDLVLLFTTVVTMLLFSLEAARFFLPGFNRLIYSQLNGLFKLEEFRQITGATSFCLAALIAVIVFPKEIIVMAFLFSTLGDPAAAFIGSRFGRLRNNQLQGSNRIPLHRKTVQGSLSFFLVSVSVVIILWGFGIIEMFWWPLIGAFTGSLIEYLPLPVDDNFSVPLASGGVVILLSTI